MYLFRLDYYERKEDREINRTLLTSEDFAVKIKNLPSKDEYKSINELKVLLWNHLEYIVKKEPN